MAQVKLNLKDLTVPEKIQMGRQVITAMTGNSNFVTPNPTLAALTAVTDQLETVFNAAQLKKLQWATAVDVQNASDKLWETAFTQEASYVQSASGGDATKILSSAMGVRDAAHPSDLPAQPQDPAVTEGDNDGELDFHWDGVKGKTAYVVQILAGENPSGAWGSDKTVTKSKIEITGLVSGTRYWLRVCAVNAAGQGPWSNPVSKIAP